MRALAKSALVAALAAAGLSCSATMDRHALLDPGLSPVGEASALEIARRAIKRTLDEEYGPAQAASRSYMAHLAPREMVTEMFGLYALSGKATAFLGPLVLGWVTVAFDSQRAGMATIIAFLVLGGALLWPLKDPTRNAT